jgi:hypothetical protein
MELAIQGTFDCNKPTGKIVQELRVILEDLDIDTEWLDRYDIQYKLNPFSGLVFG